MIDPFLVPGFESASFKETDSIRLQKQAEN
jgi:hypothetical protein